MQRCWEKPGGMMIGEFDLRTNVLDIALHKKSFTVLVGVSEEVAIIDLKEMRVTARCAGHSRRVRKLGISGDGKLAFSWSWDGTVRQCNVETDEEHKDKRIRSDGRESDEEIDEYEGTSSENELVVTGSWRGKIKIWDLCGGTRVGRTMYTSERVNWFAMGPDERIVAAGLGTGSAVLFDVETCRPLGGELKGHEGVIRDIVFGTDGRVVASCGVDGTIRLWDVESKTQVGDPVVQCEEEREFYGVAFSEDRKHIFCSESDDGWIRVWGVGNGARVRSWKAHPVVAECVTGDLGRRLVVSEQFGLMRVWNLEAEPNKQNELVYHKGDVLCVAASPDRRFFVSGSFDETVRIWDSSDGRLLGEALCGHEDRVRSVAVSPDSRRIVSGSDDCTIRVWDVGRCAQVGDALRGHESWVMCVAYSPNGEFVVSGSDDRTVRIWRVMGFCESGHVDEPAGKRVRVVERGGDKGLSSPEALRLEKTLRHGERVTSVVVSRDGQRVLSGLYYGEIWVWDITSGKFTDRKPFRQ